jgi:gamma-glutamyl-gamma-aminobutyrate hydrolase PuuD
MLGPAAVPSGRREVSDCGARRGRRLPLIVPAIGRELALEELLDSLDGLLFMGSPSNVEPRHYRGEPSEAVRCTIRTATRPRCR